MQRTLRDENHYHDKTRSPRLCSLSITNRRLQPHAAHHTDTGRRQGGDGANQGVMSVTGPDVPKSQRGKCTNLDMGTSPEWGKVRCAVHNQKRTVARCAECGTCREHGVNSTTSQHDAWANQRIMCRYTRGVSGSTQQQPYTHAALGGLVCPRCCRQRTARI